MADENTFLDAFPAWLRTLADDAVALAGLLAAESTPVGARRAIAGGLNYLFKSLDLVPDGIDDIGYLDDAFVLRIAARDALAQEGAGTADLKGTLQRLAADVPTIEAFLGDDQARLEAYVRTLAKGAARGRTVADIVDQVDVRREFVSDIHAFAKSYEAPSFHRDQKTLVKMKSFLAARLPAA
ncbi:MAG: DUF1232 domain-containing protein [Deltaproteobacteria bacterium]|nr:DUF1232 domain-containing protein [Deltaproteobacteria bacterium]